MNENAETTLYYAILCAYQLQYDLDITDITDNVVYLHIYLEFFITFTWFVICSYGQFTGHTRHTSSFANNSSNNLFYRDDGDTDGLAFIGWLISQSVNRIALTKHSLYPYVDNNHVICVNLNKCVSKALCNTHMFGLW